MPAALWLPDALRGVVPVVEEEGWRTRGRPGGFNAEGIVCHHTGPGRDDALIHLCMLHGRPDLAPPLCHVVLTRDGVWHLVASGRANHAGDGAFPWARGQVRKDGNGYLLGIEACHSGSSADPWPPAQFESYLAGVAAICRHQGWDPRQRVDTHAAFARGRKIDPTGPTPAPGVGPGVWDRDRWADLIAQRLTRGPAAPVPGPQPTYGDDELSVEAEQKIAEIHSWLSWVAPGQERPLGASDLLPLLQAMYNMLAQVHGRPTAAADVLPALEQIHNLLVDLRARVDAGTGTAVDAEAVVEALARRLQA